MNQQPEEGKASVKNIKYYLHFYQGCEVKWGADIVTLIDTDGINCNLFGETLPTKCNTSIKNIVPILRPLSDMTEEENAETSKRYFTFMEGNEYWQRDITMMAHMVPWYLSKHFDLFGLIESGIAIDKTKLNSHV